MTTILIAFLLVGSVVAIALFIWLLKMPDTAPPPRRRNPKRPSPPPPRTYNSERYRELIRLLYGDTGAAYRLVENQLQRNPGVSTEWAINKAIKDLEYDRSR